MSRKGGVPSRFQARWSHAVAWGLCKGVWSVRCVGQEHVPAEGPVILAGNHTSFLDGPMLMGMSPRPVHFLIKNELAYGIGGRILRRAGQVFVDRGNGRAALMTSLELLRDGRVVGIFPEGGRGAGKVTDVKAGVAWLAVHGGAPVVPVACVGTRMSGQGKNRIPGFRHKIYVEFGEPIDLGVDAGTATRHQVADGMLRIKDAMQRLVEHAEQASGIELPDDDGTDRADEFDDRPEHRGAAEPDTAIDEPISDPKPEQSTEKDHADERQP